MTDFSMEITKYLYIKKVNIKILFKSNKLLLTMLRLVDIHKIIRGEIFLVYD